MTHNQQSLILGEGIHAITAGSGATVVLLPGWPETAEAYNEIIPLLVSRYRVLAVDPPGQGDSAPPVQGFDTSVIGKLLETSIKSAAPDPFHLVGHDVGAWIAYAWAAQFPKRIKSLTLLDSALPGLAPQQSYPLPYELNVKLWQFSFNTLPDLPEVLTQGRERELFEWLFQHKAQHPERLSQVNRDRYVECYARPGAMSNGFAYYRAAATSARQNLEFSKTKLQMPVLALGGETGTGDRLRKSMESLAIHVEGGEIEDCGHYVMEEQPEFVAGELLRFLAKIDGAGA